MPYTSKPYLFKSFTLVIYLCYIALLFIVLEYTIRFLELTEPYTPQPNTAIKLYYDNPNGLVLLRPNAKYYTHGNVPMLINSDGYRDRLYAKKKKSNFLRIIAIGDSFTMGDGVHVANSYPKQLEALLNKKTENIEVINFGVTATNTLQHLEFLKNKVLPYNPDIVMLGFNLNDFKINKETVFQRSKRLFNTNYKVNKDKTVDIIPPKRTFLELLMSEAYKHSSVWRSAYRAKNGVLTFFRNDTSTNRIGTYDLLNFQKNIVRNNFHTISNALKEIDLLLKSRGIKFYVFMIPAMTEFDRSKLDTFDDYPFRNIHTDIEKFLKENDIMYFDILDYFGSTKIKQVVVSKFDPHFNSKGNSIIANAIMESIRDKELIY